jgi:hypothetical protein
MVGGSVCRWGVGVGVAVAALALVGPAWAEVPISENANQRFEEGVRYLSTQDADRYERAYREFKAAYADSPSWKILGNLGIVAQELERDGEAIDAFKGYLEGGGKELSAQERAQFKKDLALIESGYITVDIQSKPKGAWIVDERLPEVGRSVVNRYGPTSGPLKLRVRAGHHLVRAELAGYSSDSWEFSEEPGASVSHRMTLRPTETASEAPVRHGSKEADLPSSKAGSPALRTASYVAFGLGAVGVAAGTWFYFDGKDKSRQADAAFTRCQQANGGACPEDSDNALSRTASRLENAEGAALTRSLIGFVSGGALLTTGVVLFVMGSGESDAKEREQASILPWIGPGSLGLSGRF